MRSPRCCSGSSLEQAGSRFSGCRCSEASPWLAPISWLIPSLDELATGELDGLADVTFSGGFADRSTPSPGAVSYYPPPRFKGMVPPMTFDENDLRAVPRIPVLRDLPNRAVWRITTATSRLGERRGIDWLTYNPLQMFAYHRMARLDSSRAIHVLAEAFPTASSYADVGAGSGAYAAEAQNQGKQVVAYEYSWSGRGSPGSRVCTPGAST